MDWNRIEGNWKQLKGNVKERWGKLTDDDLNVIEGRPRATRGQAAAALRLRHKDVDDWFKTLK